MWDHIVHNRIANYFKLYTQILNYSTFILVSHRNMISVYDMANRGDDNDWLDTIKFDEGHIRHMSIKRRWQDEKKRKVSVENEMSFYEDENGKKVLLTILETFQIVVIVGTRTLKFVDMSANGYLQMSYSKDDVGRILKFFNDDRFKCGILLLTD